MYGYQLHKLGLLLLRVPIRNPQRYISLLHYRVFLSSRGDKDHRLPRREKAHQLKIAEELFNTYPNTDTAPGHAMLRVRRLGLIVTHPYWSCKEPRTQESHPVLATLVIMTEPQC